MDLKGIYDAAVAVENDIESGEISQALIDGGTLLVGLGQASKDIGFKATAEDEVLGAKISAKLKSCAEKAEKCVPKAADPAGKLFPGDGSFLKNLVQAFMTIWPLIAPLIKPVP